jgi:hypothetical protein
MNESGLDVFKEVIGEDVQRTLYPEGHGEITSPAGKTISTSQTIQDSTWTHYNHATPLLIQSPFYYSNEQGGSQGMVVPPPPPNHQYMPAGFMPLHHITTYSGNYYEQTPFLSNSKDHSNGSSQQTTNTTNSSSWKNVPREDLHVQTLPFQMGAPYPMVHNVFSMQQPFLVLSNAQSYSTQCQYMPGAIPIQPIQAIPSQIQKPIGELPPKDAEARIFFP